MRGIFEVCKSGRYSGVMRVAARLAGSEGGGEGDGEGRGKSGGMKEKWRSETGILIEGI
jgi:hypothetical protein